MPLDKYQQLPQDDAANQALQRAPTPPGLPSEGTGEDPPHSTFLPYAPIAALCLGRIVEGMMFSLIFPYINAMVHDLGVAEEDVGKWSAAAECVLFVGGTISGPFFGHLGDRFGRRPVYLLTLLGWAVGSIVFGLMRSLPGVIIGRALLGFMSGPGVLSRTIIGEITDESNAVKAFALFSPAIIVGMTLGPVVGGTFAEPVPRLLSSEWKVFDEYPYLLPAVITSFFSVVVIGMAAKYIPETRKPSRDITSANTGSQDNEADIPLMRQDSTHKGRDGDDDTKAVPTYVWPRMKQLLSHRKFQTMLLFFCVTSPLMVAYEASFPLYAYTPPDLGGLGLSVRLIGYIMGIAALFGIVLTIAAFPPIHNKLGTPGSLLLCTGCHALAAIFFPLIVHANKGMESGKLSFGAVCLLSVHFIVRKVGDFVGTLLDALVMGSLPVAEHLGMANALIFSIRQLARAFGIYGIAFVFSLSAKAPSETLGREMWWILFFAVNLPGIWLVYVTQYRSR